MLQDSYLVLSYPSLGDKRDEESSSHGQVDDDSGQGIVRAGSGLQRLTGGRALPFGDGHDLSESQKTMVVVCPVCRLAGYGDGIQAKFFQGTVVYL